MIQSVGFQLPWMTPPGFSSVLSHPTISSRTESTNRRDGPLRAHSQTTRVRHPASARSTRACASLVRFPPIFLAQNSALVAGSLNIGQSWPCQKQPCTNTTARKRGNTRSGHPGKFFRWSRKRNPRACRPDRSMSSGLVSRPRMRLMLSLRCSVVRTSAMPSSQYCISGLDRSDCGCRIADQIGPLRSGSRCLESGHHLLCEGLRHERGDRVANLTECRIHCSAEDEAVRK